MAGKIPRSFIDELMNRVDIVDVIDSRVQLKKAGRDYVACCPFHDEKTPSFTVSPSKQFYHCFGCGAHGTALGFLMEYEHMEFPEAVEELAASVNLEVPREATREHRDSDTDDLYPVLDRAASFFRRQLREHPDSAQAIEYLKGRGLSGEIAAEFGIGYAPGGWNNLLSALGSDEAAQRRLLRAGLAAEKSPDKVYDRFRDRIMFPIRDRRGRVIAFGGRILSGDGPKYLNSPETPVFHKGRELYGLFEARKALRHPQMLMVVEGYMDVVALAQFGIRYAVATLGTATTAEHLETLYRIVPRVVFCFDGDRAGREAAWRALENALPILQEGREALFLFLPEGEDPDTLVRLEGKEAFEARVSKAQPFSEFFYEALAKQVDIETVDGRARLVELAKPYLGKLREGVFRHMMLDRLADLVNLQPDYLSKVLGGKQEMAVTRPGPKRLQAPKARTPVRSAIALLLNQTSLAQSVEDLDKLKKLDLPGIELLLQLLEMLRDEPHLGVSALLERWRGTKEGVHLLRLAQMELPGNEATLRSEFLDTIRHLENRVTDQRWEFLQQKLSTQGLSEEEKTEWKQILNSRGRRNEPV